MVYIIYKKTNYQDLWRNRIDIGLYYVEEKSISEPKEFMIFGSECDKEFIEKDVFVNDKEGAYIECARRNKKIIDDFLVKDTDTKGVSCPKCGAIAEYSIYHDCVMCTSCDWNSKQNTRSKENHYD